MKRFLYLWHSIVLVIRVGILFLGKRQLNFNTTKLSFDFLSPVQNTQTGSLVDPSYNNTTTVSESSLSLQSIIDNISQYGQGSESGGLVSTEKMTELYKTNPTPENTTALIQQLAREFSYNQAYEILSEHRELRNTMSPYLIINILFNSDLVSSKQRNLSPIQAFVTEVHNNGKITDIEEQRYMSLLGIVEGKKEEFLKTIAITTPNPQEKVFSSLRSTIAQSQQGRDIPTHYQDGMIALGLFQNGYIRISQELSLRLLQEHPSYILPKQILAYSYSILHDWREAKSYFIDLISLDPENSSHYQFFVGVSSYWMNNPTDAILYLSQINDETITTDAIRYKILSYLDIKDYINAAKQLKRILGKPDVRTSDFLLFREKSIFEPYIKQEQFSLIANDKSLIELYRNRCTDAGLDKEVCLLGEVAEEVYNKNIKSTTQQIKSLTASLNKSYLFIILADSYIIQGNTPEAKSALIRALSLTEDEQIKTIIRQKLQSLL